MFILGSDDMRIMIADDDMIPISLLPPRPIPQQTYQGVQQPLRLIPAMPSQVPQAAPPVMPEERHVEELQPVPPTNPNEGLFYSMGKLIPRAVDVGAKTVKNFARGVKQGINEINEKKKPIEEGVNDLTGMGEDKINGENTLNW